MTDGIATIDAGRRGRRRWRSDAPTRWLPPTARVTLGYAQLFVSFDEGRRTLERVIAEEGRAGRTQQTARALRPPSAPGQQLAGRDRFARTTLDVAIDVLRAPRSGPLADPQPRRRRDRGARAGTLVGRGGSRATRAGRPPRVALAARRGADRPRARPRAARRPRSTRPSGRGARVRHPSGGVGAFVDRAAAHAEIAWLERLRRTRSTKRPARSSRRPRHAVDTSVGLRPARPAGAATVESAGRRADGPYALGLERRRGAVCRRGGPPRRGRANEAAPWALAETGDEARSASAYDRLQELGGSAGAASSAWRRRERLRGDRVARGSPASGEIRERPSGARGSRLSHDPGARARRRGAREREDRRGDAGLATRRVDHRATVATRLFLTFAQAHSSHARDRRRGEAAAGGRGLLQDG